MKITTDHAASSYGVPVILDDSGAALDYAPGVRAVRARLGLSRAQLAAACGVSSRTVEGWELGRPVAVAGLYALQGLLSGKQAAKAKARP